MTRPDWSPTSRLNSLRSRALLLQKLREFFSARGFLEVETPLISRDTVVDRFLEPIRISAGQLGLVVPRDAEYFLQTSPEFAMKRLLAAGLGKIYQICKAFRAGENGALHNPEFTIVEWYDPQADYEAGLNFLAELAIEFLGAENCRRVTYADAFSSRVLDENGRAVCPLIAPIETLRTAAQNYAEADSTSIGNADRDNVLNILWGTVIEPNLGIDNPEIVFDWPPGQSALAKTRATSRGLVAERFELYFRGVELANGYHELANADVLAERANQANQLRYADGKSALPVDSRLLNAFEAAPQFGAGVAMGLDRLLMVLTGASSISEVIAFPIDRA